MGKVRGQKGNKDAIHRKPFVGDPANCPPPKSEPGTSKRKNKPGYKAPK